MRSPSASATSAAGGVGVPDAENSPPSRSASPATASRSSRTTTDGARRTASSAARRSAAMAGRASPCALGIRAHSTDTTAAWTSVSSRRRRAASLAALVRPDPGAPQNSAPPAVGDRIEIVFSGNPKLVSSSGRRRNAAFSFAVAKATAVSACAPSAVAGSSSRAGCVATASPSRLETAVPSRPRGLRFFLLTEKSLASAGEPSSTRAARAGRRPLLRPRRRRARPRRTARPRARRRRAPPPRTWLSAGPRTRNPRGSRGKTGEAYRCAPGRARAFFLFFSRVFFFFSAEALRARKTTLAF